MEHLISLINTVNKRTLVIVAALALPVVVLAVVMHSGSSKNNGGRLPAVAGNAIIIPHLTLVQAIAVTKNRLAELEKMTPEQWPQEQKIHPNSAPTLQSALIWNKNHLAQLEAMTPQQWEARFNPRPPVAAAPPKKPQAQSALDIIPQPTTAAQKPVLPSTSGQ